MMLIPECSFARCLPPNLADRLVTAEHNFTQGIRIAERGYVIVHGRISFEGESADALNANELIPEFYLEA